MKKLPLLFILCLLAATAFVSSCSDDDNNSSDYTEWIAQNQQWYDSLAALNVNGTSLYQEVNPSWYKNTGVLMRYYNNRALTAGNLKPYITSSVKVKYKGEMCNGVAFDSSYTETDSCRIFTLNSGLITGWQIALTDMNVGDSADVILPYYMAYGASGSGTILPYSNLKFSIKLVDIPDFEVKP